MTELKSILIQLVGMEQEFASLGNEAKVSQLAVFAQSEKNLLDKAEHFLAEWNGKVAALAAPDLLQEVRHLAGQAQQWHETNQTQIQSLTVALKHTLDKTQQALALTRQYQAATQTTRLHMDIEG
jgi:uncharacterized protein YoxC